MRSLPILLFAVLAFLPPAGHAAPEPAPDPSLEDAVGAFEGDPAAARDLVARRLAFRPYAGFLKGPAGAWADRTANAADAAWLLLHILRAKGHEARLAQRVLDGEDATVLLRSALPAKGPAPEIAALLPGDATAAPIEDPELRERVGAHVFVQVKQGEEWADLDPFLPRPAPDRRGTPEPIEGDGPPEESRRLRIEVCVKPEGEDGPATALSFEAPVADLYGKPIALCCLGVDEADRGKRAATARLRPALWVDGTLHLGEPFGGPVPEATPADPAGKLGGVFGDGEEEAAPGERTVPPAIAEVRVELTLALGGAPERRERRYLYLAGPDGLDRLDDLTAFAVAFDGPAPGAARTQAAAAAAGKKPDEKPLLPASGELTEAQKKEAGALFARAAALAGSLAACLADSTGRLARELDGAYGTTSFAGDARIASVSLDGRRNRLMTDLVFDSFATLSRPGTKASARAAVLGARGLLSAELEGSLLATGLSRGGSSVTPLTVRSVFAAARAAGVKGVVLGAENAGLLDGLPFPPRTRRILGERLAADRVALVVAKPVEVGGRPVVAWMEAERATGEWRGVFEDGRHQAIAEGEAVSGIEGAFAGFGFAFIGGFSGTLFSFASAVLGLIDESDTSFNLIAAQAIDSAAQVDWNSVLLEAWGDTEGMILLGGGPEGLVIGQMGMFAGQATAIHFLRAQFPR
ncbi:MAG: hypothetical protein MUE73_03930 [Planctomycetes bacterium]|jgi:hypothetical protein|nr:hypothetical protein [Planctomycetota bacterium]